MNIRQIVATALLALLAMALLLELPTAIADRSREYDWYTPVIDVRTLLDERYVTEVDDEAMQQAALRAMVEALDDPHTVYIPPADQDVFEKEVSGRYSGIGAEIRQQNGRLLIVTPLDDSPALEAGLAAGDLVLSIDGTDTKGLGAQGCMDLLLGEPGSPVQLQVQHPDNTESTITVIRGPIDAGSIEGFMRRDGAWNWWIDERAGLGYVKLTQFTQDTARELHTVLADHADSLKGLVIDLRGNPGGALPAAVDASDLFIDEGPIVHIKPGRDDRQNESHSFSARAGDIGEDVPVVVLVDQGSASASEILAGALKQQHDARVLGARTFGKGSVQEVRPLEDGQGLLKFTTAYYAVPDGRILQRSHDDPTAAWGVDPSQGCVVMETPEERLARFQAREPWRVIHRDEPTLEGTIDAAWIESTLEDAALARGTSLILDRLETGDWPELPESETPSYRTAGEDLNLALDAHAVLLDQLADLEQRIETLQGAGIEQARGLIDLPEDAKVGGLEVVLRDAEGNVIGTWRAADAQVAQSALQGARLERIGDN